MNQLVPPALADVPFLPRDDNNEVVFSAPWEARAFAVVVALHQQGHFTWPEWAECLGEEIAAAAAADDGSQYYQYWLSAAEKLVVEKALCDADALGQRKDSLELAQGGPAPA